MHAARWSVRSLRVDIDDHRRETANPVLAVSNAHEAELIRRTTYMPGTAALMGL
jgi:hypothetical protein